MSSNRNKVILEYFTSKNCLYCRASEKMIKKAQEKFGDKLQVQTIDIDTPQGQVLKQIYLVQGTPTIVINRSVAFRGLPPGQEELNEKIKEYL